MITKMIKKLNELATQINELAEKIDNIDANLEIPFFYKTYERMEAQRELRNKLAKEHNQKLRKWNKLQDIKNEQ